MVMQGFCMDGSWTCYLSRLSSQPFRHWLPFVGGDDFVFFSPIFNIADASISTGVITLLLFQKRFFQKT